MIKPATIVLAAGGTGGHLYPAEALAQELLNRGHNVIIITDKRGQAFRKLGDNVHIDCVRAATFKSGLISKIKAILDIMTGVMQSLFLLRRYKPALMVGFGGYPSFPPMMAGQILRRRTILHEQNATLGKANLWLAPGAHKIALSLPGTRGIKPEDEAKTIVTGNPVRADICAVRNKPYPATDGPLNILITGGSQGAKVFGDVVPDAVAKLPDDIRKRLRIVHQCPEGGIAATLEKYRNAGVKAEIKAFFNDMPERLAACHLFIGRSGASTVAEIAVAGRPAIFVPYPGHADQQQKHNAELVADKEGGWIMMQDQFSPAALTARLEELAKDPARLERAAQNAKACGRPEAVKNLADLVESEIIPAAQDGGARAATPRA